MDRSETSWHLDHSWGGVSVLVVCVLLLVDLATGWPHIISGLTEECLRVVRLLITTGLVLSVLSIIRGWVRPYKPGGQNSRTQFAAEPSENPQNLGQDHFEIIYEQYWEHARHQESERLYFTEIYSALVAGVLLFLSTSSSSDSLLKIGLYIFLLILTIVGFFVIYSCSIPFVIFSRLTEQIAVCQWNVSRQYLRWNADLRSARRKPKAASVWSLFALFYSAMGALFTGLVLEEIGNLFWRQSRLMLALASAFVVFTILVMVHRRFFRGYAREIENEIAEVIRICQGESR